MDLARTQAADYEQRREAIVEHAADLFAELGFRGASVSDLAKACQTSKSLIYHYFPSKEDVLNAVMLSHIDQLVEDAECVMALEKPPRERLHLLLHRFMAYYMGAASRQKVLLIELGNLPDDKRRSIIGKQRIVMDVVQSLIVAIDPAMAVDRGRARAQTMLLFGMINWTMTWFDNGGPISADTIAEMVLNLVAPA